MERKRDTLQVRTRLAGGPMKVPPCRCGGACRCGGLVPTLLLRRIEAESEFFRKVM